MSESTYKNLILTPKVVVMMSKITEDKLIGLNDLDWSKTVHLYLRSIRMASHLTEDPLTNDSKDRWLEDDASLFLQIRNSIDGKVLTLINHCEFVDAPIFGGSVDNSSTRGISILGNFAPKFWHRTSTNYMWTPSYSEPPRYVPSPGPIHSYLNLKYENKTLNYSP